MSPGLLSHKAIGGGNVYSYDVGTGAWTDLSVAAEKVVSHLVLTDTYAYLDSSGDVYIELLGEAAINLDSDKTFAISDFDMNVVATIAAIADDGEAYTLAIGSLDYTAISPSVTTVLSGNLVSVCLDSVNNVGVVDDTGAC